MKKLSRKRWLIDVKEGLAHRQGRSKTNPNPKTNPKKVNHEESINDWIEYHKYNGLNCSIARNKVVIILPEKLNFDIEYEITTLYLRAIRKLVEDGKKLPKTKRNLSEKYRLASVNFDNLKSISTSAALVLTAELSKWDDAIRNKLQPTVKKWDSNILINFFELGFFELFNNKPNIDEKIDSTLSDKKIIKYIKGRCGDDQKTRDLKNNLIKIVGSEIEKWIFLHSGLSEAIVNVVHHAYPEVLGYCESDKNWYLTGSYSTSNRELTVVFYDQGIGIPKSLPASEIWEKLLSFLSKKIPYAEQKRDEVLLRAAIEMDRTSTEESDRGKGLQDLLEFIRQRGEGSLSILSLKGLFDMEVKNGRETIISKGFHNKLGGTLIIWTVIV